MTISRWKAGGLDKSTRFPNLGLSITLRVKITFIVTLINEGAYFLSLALQGEYYAINSFPCSRLY